MGSVTLLTQSITLFDERNLKEYGSIELRQKVTKTNIIVNINEWVWIEGDHLMESGEWKLENVLVADKLWKVMNLDNKSSFIQIVNHTRWTHSLVPLHPWFVDGDNSGGTAKLGSMVIDFKVKLKK